MGRSSRAARAHSHPAYDSPRTCARSQDSALAAPPAKKNSGMICSSQVSAWVQGKAASRLPSRGIPSGHATTAITPCPATTTSSATARAASTTRSRSGGVASAARRAGTAAKTCSLGTPPPSHRACRRGALTR